MPGVQNIIAPALLNTLVKDSANFTRGFDILFTDLPNVVLDFQKDSK